jgi:hypothetical protein
LDSIIADFPGAPIQIPSVSSTRKGSEMVNGRDHQRRVMDWLRNAGARQIRITTGRGKHPKLNFVLDGETYRVPHIAVAERSSCDEERYPATTAKNRRAGAAGRLAVASKKTADTAQAHIAFRDLARPPRGVAFSVAIR